VFLAANCARNHVILRNPVHPEPVKGRDDEDLVGGLF